ncbi:MAG: HAD family hydrolase [Neisseriaceae bacterium]|jgi:phosphoglycolate phosphatase
MKKYLLYIFDWQDTLVDGYSGIIFDGVLELLKYLKANGIKVAIATGSGRESFEMMLKIVNLEGYFDYTKTISECKHKPDPDMLNQILDQSCVDRKDAIMIGDTEYDIEMANSAGIDSVWISNNSYSSDTVSATHYLHNINELYELVTE